MLGVTKLENDKTGIVAEVTGTVCHSYQFLWGIKLALALAPLPHPPKPPQWTAGALGGRWQSSARGFLRAGAPVDLTTISCPPRDPPLHLVKKIEKNWRHFSFLPFWLSSPLVEG